MPRRLYNDKLIAPPTPLPSPSSRYHTLSNSNLVESGTEKQLPYRVYFRVRMSYCDKAASWDAAPSFTNDHNVRVTKAAI